MERARYRFSVVASLAIGVAACSSPSADKAASSGARTSSAKPSTTNSAGASAAPPASAAASAAPSAASEPAPPPANVPEKLEGANITLDDAEIEGTKIKKTQCKAPGANPLAFLGVLGPIAKQKAALDACVPKPSEVRVHFVAQGKKVSDVRVAGAPDSASAACIAKLVEATEIAQDLTCVLDLPLGPAAK